MNSGKLLVLASVILKRTTTIASFWSLTAFASIFGFAQVPPDLQIGLVPFGSYHGSDIDKVSLQNGNLHVSIPLFALPQRGGQLKLSFSLINNNKIWATAPCSVTFGGHVCPSFTQCHSSDCSSYWTVNSYFGYFAGVNIAEDEYLSVGQQTDDRGHTTR